MDDVQNEPWAAPTMDASTGSRDDHFPPSPHAMLWSPKAGESDWPSAVPLGRVGAGTN